MKPETAQTAKTMVGIAAGIASVAIPGAAIPIQIGRAAAVGLIEAYDALMASRPAEVTVEEWRAILAGPVHSPNFVDGLVNEARSNRTATT